MTLPGSGFVVVGSNGRVAWGFTNSQGDWADLVVLEPDPESAAAYRTPEGPRVFERSTETIHAKGAPDERLDVSETIWGPVVDADHQGRKRALAWVPLREGGLNAALVARLDVPPLIVTLGSMSLFRGIAEGLTQAAVRAPQLTRRQRDGLFWVNTAAGTTLALLAVAAAGPIAGALGQPALAPIIRALALTFVLNGLVAQYRAGLSRDLRFGTLAGIDLLATLT